MLTRLPCKQLIKNEMVPMSEVEGKIKDTNSKCHSVMTITVFKFIFFKRVFSFCVIYLNNWRMIVLRQLCIPIMIMLTKADFFNLFRSYFSRKLLSVLANHVLVCVLGAA